MKKILSLSFALVIVAFNGTAQPKLKVLEGEKFDLGKVDRGAVMTKRLTLRNVGSDTLKLGNVEVSCGCTGTVVSNKLLKAGDTTSLLISFNSRNFSGPVHKSLTINSNSADAPRMLIEFTATVIEDLVFSPMQFYFKDAQVGSKSTAVVKVRNEGSKEFMITGFRSTLENFVIKYPPKAISPGKTMEITAEYTPRTVMPALSNGVFITTSSLSQAEVYIYIFGNVKEFKFE